ncbi:hypothetical protein GGR53DRAFT_470480 [Hypoxylon sp. FL1150]|nr:hypothetical protein GGR53DRAFT_470480 [Hypoxylon sp. FL1150]
MSQNNIVNQGVTQVLTGLGILIGTGTISNETHTRIMALLTGDGGHDTVENVSSTTKETSSEVDQKKELEPLYSVNLVVGGGFDHLDNVGSSSWAQEPLVPEPSCTSPATNVLSEPAKPTSLVKTVCPWWLTNGYDCRDRETGKCPWIHKFTAGAVQDPLICFFWAHGDRCTKTAQTCRFAHYRAHHGVVAPTPPKKKAKKPQSTFGNESSVWSGSTRSHRVPPQPKESDIWGVPNDSNDETSPGQW